MSRRKCIAALSVLFILVAATSAPGERLVSDLFSLADHPVDYSRLPGLQRNKGRLDAEGDSPAYIGSFGQAGEFFDGDLDDVRIYGKALSPSQVGQLADGAPSVANDALTAWWPFDGNTKNVARPQQRAVLHGNHQNYTRGRLNQALRLSGDIGSESRRVRVDSYPGLKPKSGEITLSAWIRPAKTPDEWMEIYRKEDGNARQLLAIGRTGFYGLWCGFGIDGDYVETGVAIDRRELANGQWHHVAATYHDKTIRLFHNGRLKKVRRLSGDDDDIAASTTADADGRNPLRVVFLGNTLIQRAGEFACVETELTRLFPQRDIIFRNLGWPGDNVNGDARREFGPNERSRSGWRRPNEEAGDYGFRKMMEQIRRQRPNVIFIAYGSNVAFEAEEGLQRFQTGLARLLDTLAPTGARIVLMSPPPRETWSVQTSHLDQQNRWLAQVADCLRRVAQERQLTLIDLFREWPRSMETEPRFTDNGIHLNRRGYRILASIVAQRLAVEEPGWQVHLQADGKIVRATGTSASAGQRTEYGLRWQLQDERLPSIVDLSDSPQAGQRVLRLSGLTPGTYSLDIDGRRVARADADQWQQGVRIVAGPDVEQLEQLRQTILRKNRAFFYRFRPQNKAYIQLFRRHERGHHAAEIRRFTLLVDDAESEIARLRQPRRRIYELVREKDYPDHEVPGESAEANLEDELAALRIPDGFQINLFASDPMIAKPININWDERGRMWVATSTIYPHLQPGQTPNDQIIILEDIDRDGQADKRTVFADQLLVPHSVVPGGGGAYVTQSTDLLFLRDNDGDDRADERRILLTGFGNADVHHMIHALRWGPDGDLYFNQSIYINSVVETPWGVRVSNGSCIWRLRPETLRLEMFSQGLVNPWGHAFNPWGQSFATDGAGGSGLAYVFPGSAFTSHGYAGRELTAMNPGRPKECGLEFLSGRHLPADWRGTWLSNDFRANRVTRYRLTENASGYASKFLGDVITSSHRGFRPVDIKMGPDGAIYIVDWYNLIIDHGEVDFHHPLRDKRHGRIWRLTAKDSPLVQPPQLANASPRELLDALTLPEQWTRDQARRLLRERRPDDVLPALGKWIAESTRTEHDLLEALWVYQGLRVANVKLLSSRLQSEDHRIRAAAVRVLTDWHEQVANAMQLFETLVEDPHPQVRLEAVNGLRTVGTLPAINVAMRAIHHPMDRELDFALFRTAHQRRAEWLPAFRSGESVFDGDPDRIAFALSSAGDEAPLEPLAELVSAGTLRGDSVGDVLRVLASLGNARQRALVLQKLPNLALGERRQVLMSLVQSDREPVPSDERLLLPMLSATDQQVRHLALELVGRWKLRSAWTAVESRAADATIPSEERLIAARALVEIDAPQSAKTLQRIFAQANADAIRATTVSAWAQQSAAEAAPHAVSLLASLEDMQLVAMIANAFLKQKSGAEQLTAALSDTQIPAAVAQRVIDEVRMTGREMPQLLFALRTAGRLPALKDLTADEIASIIQDAVGKGDAKQGAAIFQRERLRCVTCHAVNGKGGQVGPDLSSLGGSARVGEILQSVLNPSATIKEGYQTTHVATVDGRIVTGIIKQQSPSLIRVRDQSDKLHTITVDDIDELEPSKLSVMPTGLAELLTRDELVDLISYLSSLGRAE